MRLVKTTENRIKQAYKELCMLSADKQPTHDQLTDDLLFELFCSLDLCKKKQADKDVFLEKIGPVIK